MSSMKIIQIINSLETGGAEKLSLNLHKLYVDHGHESYLISLSGDKYGWMGEGVFSLGLTTPYNPFAIVSLLDLKGSLDLTEADIIHAHLFPAQLITGLIRENIPCSACFVATEHSTSNRRRGTFAGRMIDRWFYRRFDRIVCVSPAAAKELGGWMTALSGRLEAIFNGIDLDEFTVRNLSPDPFRKIVLSVGRLTEAKNYPVAIEAFSLLRNRSDLDLQYWIAGGGVLEKSLKNLAEKFGVTECVKFLGEVSDTSSVMKQADVFFMPSLREGFGIAALEAMSTGLPVVASRLPGIGDVVGEDCGILVDPSSPGEMAEALQSLLEDDQLSWQMGSAGMERAREFSIEVTAARYIDLFKNVLEQER